MQPRAPALASAFEAANTDLIETVAACSEADWRRPCAGEGWTVAVTAHHVAVGHSALLTLLQRAAAGERVQLSFDQLHDRNARHAEEFAECDQDDTIALLRLNGAEVSAAVRSLSESDLSRDAGDRADGTPRRIAELIERGLIGHVRAHLTNIRDALR